MVKRERKIKKGGPLAGQKFYKKEGGGTFRMENRIIKPGQKFWASPKDIPEAFRDVVVEIEAPKGVEVPKEKKIKAPVIADFKLKKSEKKEDGKWLYHVVDKDDKVISENPLLKKPATELLDSLNK